MEVDTVIEAYIIHPDGRGELKKIDADQPPSYVEVKIFTPEPPSELKNGRDKINIKLETLHTEYQGYRWVGKVKRFAHLYCLNGG